jgi:hypothetical protein
MEPQNFAVEIDRDEQGRLFLRLLPKTSLARAFMEQFAESLGVRKPLDIGGYKRGEASISAGWRNDYFAELAVRPKDKE